MSDVARDSSGCRIVRNMDVAIPRGSFLVYYFRTRDQVRCHRDGSFLDGSNEAGVLFSDLSPARVHAQSVASVDPAIGSGIYDSSWNVIETHVHERFTEQQAASNSPLRLSLWAGVMIIVGVLSLWMEIHSGWTLMFGFLIGARLLFAGLVRAGRGISAFRRTRNRKASRDLLDQ